MSTLESREVRGLYAREEFKLWLSSCCLLLQVDFCPHRESVMSIFISATTQQLTSSVLMPLCRDSSLQSQTSSRITILLTTCMPRSRLIQTQEKLSDQFNFQIHILTFIIKLVCQLCATTQFAAEITDLIAIWLVTTSEKQCRGVITTVTCLSKLFRACSSILVRTKIP